MYYDKNSLLSRKYALIEQNRSLRKDIASYGENSFFGKRSKLKLEGNLEEIAAIDHDLELLFKDK